MNVGGGGVEGMKGGCLSWLGNLQLEWDVIEELYARD